MLFFNRLIVAVLCAALICPLAPAATHDTRKGTKYFTEGRAYEAKKEWDMALESYEKALAENPSDIQFQMAVQKTRFAAAQQHVDAGIKLRDKGDLADALLEFKKAFGVSPGSSAAVQEVQTTQEMIRREQERMAKTGKEAPPEVRGLTPMEQLKLDTQERLSRIQGVPELRPLGPAKLDLTINSNVPKTLFETLAGVAGINVVWDPDYIQNTQPVRSPSASFQSATLNEALDYLCLLTKSFWKPISSNAIFVAQDTPQKRRDFADQVTRVFYLSNVFNATELQEIVNAVRSVAEVNRLFAYNEQNAIIARDEADKVALVEKMIHDLDRPKAEVMVDIVVMETTSSYQRQLAAALAPTGLNVPANWNPRGGLQVQTSSSSSSSSTTTSTSSTTTGTTGTTTGSSTTGSAVPLANLARISSADFSTTLPSALLEAVMSDANNKVLQAPQMRSVDGAKATLKIGDRIPYAQGSFGSTLSSGSSASGYSGLVNTQFNYNDVGVNVDLTPRIHENGDISMEIDLDVSDVNGYSNIGGIQEPIIAQRKMHHFVRMHEGEVGLLGGLMKLQDSKTTSGIPGLAKIPLLGRLFTSESVDRQRDELMIAVVPHIIRRPEITAEALRAINVGTATAIHLTYAPKPDDGSAPPAPAVKPQVITPQAQATPAQPAAQQQTPATPAPQNALPGPVPQALQQLLRPMPGTLPTGAPGAPGQAPAGVSAARFDPPRLDTAVNTTFAVGVIVDNAADAASASPLQVQYDPRMLSLTDASAGDLFSRDGVAPVFARNIQNDQGLATIQIGRPAGASGVNGSGVLVTLRFQALRAGATSIAALNVTLRNSQGIATGSSSPQLPVTIR